MGTPALAHLMGAYFHLDWAEEFDGDPWRAVGAYLAGTPDLAPELAGEIGGVLESNPSDDEVQRYLASLGSCFTPTAAEGGYRGWLTEVARRVSEATSK